MPRYTAVAPTFTPLDYKTRIAPLEQYKEEYDKRMDALDEQGVLADAIGGLIDRDDERDAGLAKIYDDYNDKMVSTAQNLLQTGDLGSSRRALGELRRDYANKLIPIQQAYNSRAEAGKTWREASLKDRSLIGTDPLEHSISDYMHGNIPNDKVVSGMELYALGQAGAKAASGREFRETAWRLDKNLGNQFFSRVQKEGWSQDEVVDALAHYAGSSDKSISEDAKKLLNFIVSEKDRIGSSAGISELGDENKIAKANNYILEGIISGIGYQEKDSQKEYDPYKFETAKYNMEAAKYRALSEKQKYEAGLNKQKDRPSIGHQAIYKGQDSEGKKLLDKATSELANPITNQYTGEIIRDAIDATRALHYNDKRQKELEDRKREIEKSAGEIYGSQGQYIVRDKVRIPHPQLPDAGTTRYQNNDKLTTEYNNIVNELNSIEADNRYRTLTYKPFALSDKEYDRIVEMAGGNRDFTKEDLVYRTFGNIKYSNAFEYSDQTLASKGKMSGLKEEMATDMRRAILNSPDKKFIYRTKDGITKDGKAVKVSSDTFDNDNIESIEINPFNAAEGYIKIITKKDGQFLFPIGDLRNEAGKAILNRKLSPDSKTTRQQDIYQLIYGDENGYSPVDRNGRIRSIEDRFYELDEQTWDIADEIATVYGYDLRQMLGATSSKGQYEFDRERE